MFEKMKQASEKLNFFNIDPDCFVYLVLPKTLKEPARLDKLKVLNRWTIRTISTYLLYPILPVCSFDKFDTLLRVNASIRLLRYFFKESSLKNLVIFLSL